MESSHVIFSELNLGRGMQRIAARLLRFWEARNIKKGGELMSVDLLLLDEKSTMMQASIPVNQLLIFQSLIHEGSLYSITGFDVLRSNTRFKLTDFHLSIRLTESTTLTQLDEACVSIPKELFRFRSHAHYWALGNTNTDLPDIMGEFGSTKAYSNEVTGALERMVVHLRLESGEEVCVSAFDAQATALHNVLVSNEAGPCVMIVTNVNPKIFAGGLYLNATSATRYFIDGEVHATRAFHQRVKGKGIHRGISSSKYQAMHKIEHLSITELNAYLTTSTVQDGEFLCTAKVAEIQNKNGWNYIACSKCSKKMTKHETTLACINCNSHAAVGNVKYRVEMVVDDGAAKSTFVAFDKDIVKLIKLHAETLAIEMVMSPNSQNAYKVTSSSTFSEV